MLRFSKKKKNTENKISFFFSFQFFFSFPTTDRFKNVRVEATTIRVASSTCAFRTDVYSLYPRVCVYMNNITFNRIARASCYTPRVCMCGGGFYLVGYNACAAVESDGRQTNRTYARRGGKKNNNNKMTLSRTHAARFVSSIKIFKCIYAWSNRRWVQNFIWFISKIFFFNCYFSVLNVNRSVKCDVELSCYSPIRDQTYPPPNQNSLPYTFD